MTRQMALLQMHIAAILFGLSGILGYLITADSIVISMGRSGFAVIALTGLSVSRCCIPWRVPLKTFYTLFLAGLLLAGHWVTFFHAIKVGNVAVATLGFACFPVFVTLLELFFFKEKLTFTECCLLVCVSVGLILVTPSFSLDDGATVGLIYGIVSGGLYAMTVVVNRYSLANASGIQVCWWQCLVVLIVLLPFSVSNLPNVMVMDWVWIGCLGVLCTGGAYYLFMSSLVTIKARTASIIIALEPVYAILGAWLFFNQAPTTKTVIGGAIIVLTVVFVGLQKQQNT